ncbi:MAG: Arm DNA-binding domain-containing protein, partial [Sphingomonadaceae bacterium]|nr:Arm DNA-binding domain-containing protein [Sphingomonadaceae bacterium]
MGRSARADLTVRQAETTTKIGYTADGKQPGLNLQVTASASGYARSWVFRYTSPTTGKRRELGLGPLSSVGLAKAREKAREAGDEVTEGIDPKDARDAAKAQNLAWRQRLTFEEAAAQCIA